MATTGSATTTITQVQDADALAYAPSLRSPTQTSYGWTTQSARTAVLVLTALVVDDEADARRRVTGLLRLGGWQVGEAADRRPPLRQAATTDPDLVVTDPSMAGETGPAMLRRLRGDGSRARFLVVDRRPLAGRPRRGRRRRCAGLPGQAGRRPAPPRLPAQPDHGAGCAGRPDAIHEVDDLHDADIDADLDGPAPGDLRDRAAGPPLGHRHPAPASGDALAVASAAYTLAGTSGQLGHPEVASICQAIAGRRPPRRPGPHRVGTCTHWSAPEP